MMNDCDTLLMVGSSFPYSEFLPKEGKARGVQIDIDPRMLGLRYPMEVALVGDSAETLRALLPLLKVKKDGKWRSQIEGATRDWSALMEERAHVAADPVNPELVFWHLSRRLPDDSIITADSGTVASWYARHVQMRPGMMGSLSGGLATMGNAVPYAIAAKMAFSDRPVFALVGDGAMQMNGNAELLTAAAQRHKWKDQRLIVLVLNNGDLNMVTWEMRVMSGNPRYEASQRLPPFNYAEYAERIGFLGLRVERPEEVAAAWDQALASDRPVVIDAVTDPNVPPSPPAHHI